MTKYKTTISIYDYEKKIIEQSLQETLDSIDKKILRLKKRKAKIIEKMQSIQNSKASSTDETPRP